MAKNKLSDCRQLQVNQRITCCLFGKTPFRTLSDFLHSGWQDVRNPMYIYTIQQCMESDPINDFTSYHEIRYISVSLVVASGILCGKHFFCKFGIGLAD